MTKTTFNLCKKKSKPPGLVITNEKSYHDVGSVSFPKRKSLGILSPYVEAYYSKEDKSLTAKAVVYVDVNLENAILKCKVYQNCYLDIDGNAQLQFFIAYDLPEKVSKNFTIYEIDFTVDKEAFVGEIENVKTIQTFLWDTDPETSRGTETTVQDSN